MTVRNNRKSPERNHDHESCYWEEEEEEEEDFGRLPEEEEWWRKEKKGYVHSQVLRIREEDSHVGRDLLDVLKAGSGAGVVKDSNYNNYNLMIKNMVAAAASSPVNDRAVVLLTRPLLPSSPLSRKTTVN